MQALSPRHWSLCFSLTLCSRNKMSYLLLHSLFMEFDEILLWHWCIKGNSPLWHSKPFQGFTSSVVLIRKWWRQCSNVAARRKQPCLNHKPLKHQLVFTRLFPSLSVCGVPDDTSDQMGSSCNDCDFYSGGTRFEFFRDTEYPEFGWCSLQTPDANSDIRVP
jgi:hypothetical protein